MNVRASVWELGCCVLAHSITTSRKNFTPVSRFRRCRASIAFALADTSTRGWWLASSSSSSSSPRSLSSLGYRPTPRLHVPSSRASSSSSFATGHGMSTRDSADTALIAPDREEEQRLPPEPLPSAISLPSAPASLGWTACRPCRGTGAIQARPSKRHRRQSGNGSASAVPAQHLQPQPRLKPNATPARPHKKCPTCDGAGIVPDQTTTTTNTNTTTNSTTSTVPTTTMMPTSSVPEDPTISADQHHGRPQPLRVAVVGGGLAGLALAAACRHRNIQCTVFERDIDFAQRQQGYGLTLQQAASALRALGLKHVAAAAADSTTVNSATITSTRHVVHSPDGTIVGTWGYRQWGRVNSAAPPKRQNLHIPRQTLRRYLLDAAGGDGTVLWDHQFITFLEPNAPRPVDDKDGTSGNGENGNPLDTPSQAGPVVLEFEVGSCGVRRSYRADIVVGADGIRSAVRDKFLSSAAAARTPLRYLGCLVVLGICPLVDVREAPASASSSSSSSSSSPSELLDGATVFQTADGTTRLYSMPYSTTQYMWQVSFPLDELAARALSRCGPTALLDEARQRCGQWHAPIPQLLAATPPSLVSGYPVYDRAPLEDGDLDLASQRVALIGDACHPMSPFKGQGANQALLDALAVARALHTGIPLSEAQRDVLRRATPKVEASAAAARFLHSPAALRPGNVTRGRAAELAEAETAAGTAEDERVPGG